MTAAEPGRRSLILPLVFVLLPALASAQSDEAVRAQAQREKQPLLDTLQHLVSIESGSGDVEGVTRIGLGIAERLRALGGSVELVKPAADMPRITSVPREIR